MKDSVIIVSGGMDSVTLLYEYADSIAIRLIDDFSKELRHIRSLSNEFTITGGIATFHMFALWGDRTAASANGRLAYDALAPNYSPVPGADKGGPLLALASSLKPDLSELLIYPLMRQISMTMMA